MSPFPVGPGNFRNLEAAKNALESGKKVIVLMPADLGKIDFVGGKAADFITGLINQGAVRVANLQGVLDQVHADGAR